MKLLTGLREPMQTRVYVPDAHGDPGYVERDQLVSAVRVLERGADTLLTVSVHNLKVGELLVPAVCGEPLMQRLFREVPRVDRVLFQELMDDFEDAIVAKDAAKRTLVRRRLLGALDSMAADLATLGGAHPSKEPMQAIATGDGEGNNE